MPTLEIDGQSVTVEDGANLIDAAAQLGTEVPHYCYHPGLSVAGNCRMCLVEIEKMPKLQIACNTRATEGMVVHTKSEKVLQARESVLEFLLVNHPIDCPICDQAGECKLQDYYMEHDRQESRTPLEAKVHKGKAIDIGPLIMLDQERCILCTRCTRFLDEVTGTNELGIFQRGNHCQIDVFPGIELDNHYSGTLPTSVRSARSPTRISVSGLGFGTSIRPSRSAPVAPPAATSTSTTAAMRSSASGRGSTRTSTATGCATKGD